MNIRFIDTKHQNSYNQLCEKYAINQNSRDHVLLMYLLSAIIEADDPRINDLISKDNSGILVKDDALSHEWITEGYARIIRLAFHLYTWKAPTTSSLTEKLAEEELKQYLPMELLCGLDNRLTEIALESLRMLCYWS